MSGCGSPQRLRRHAPGSGRGEARWLASEQGVLAVSVDDHRLTWPERELVRQLGERPTAGGDREAANG